MTLAVEQCTYIKSYVAPTDKPFNFPPKQCNDQEGPLIRLTRFPPDFIAYSWESLVWT